MMTMATHPLWNAAEAQAATGGKIAGDWSVTGVSIDSRTVQKGDLFIALKGPSFDGHAFVADALAKGAAAAMVDAKPEGDVAEDRLLLVEDTTEALRDLARAARARSSARVIGVTGSVGKTGVKEMLTMALAGQGRTHATQGNLNNHYGLPLTLARMPRETEYAVLEMGMNHAGELTPLSLLARPHVAIITTIERVHSEYFESTEGIADAKAEIFKGLERNGTAILNQDNDYFGRLRAAAMAQGIDAIVGFGENDEAAAHLDSLQVKTGGSAVRASIMGEALSYSLGLAGRHWAMNSLAVLTAVKAAGAVLAWAAAALKDMHAPKGRGSRHPVKLGDQLLTVVDESYNASPVSMRAALSVLGETEIEKGGRRIAVLGDMLELGADADGRHAALVDAVKKAGIDLVYTAGARMRHLWEALPHETRGGHAASAEQLSPIVTSAVRGGDVVMVKGSAGSRTGAIVDALLALDTNGENGNGPERIRAANGG